MLILFKPWKHPHDLCSPNQTWESAFAEFVPNLLRHHCSIIENMQRLHECKDSWDEDFAARKMKLRGDNQRDFSDDLVNATEAGLMDNNLDNEDSALLATALDDIMAGCTKRQKLSESDADVVVKIGKAMGFFDPAQLESDELRSNSALFSDFQNSYLESEWKASYDENKLVYKNSLRIDEPSTAANPGQSIPDDDNGITVGSCRPQSESPVLKHELNGVSYVQASREDKKSEGLAKIEEFVEQFTLNPKQAHAFCMVAEHSMNHDGSKPPLRMLMHGPGGTGKSRVIEALSAFFNDQGETRRFRLSAYTGVAAQNILGMTLHMALQLLQLANMQKSSTSKARKDLIDFWTGVDYLFIDKVSMIGVELLACLNEALNIAKALDSKGAGIDQSPVFGNLSVIFAGDFCQLKPVMDTSLFASTYELTGTYRDSQTPQGQNKLIGKQLWSNITSVIMLHRSMRQRGDSNKEFRELLSCLRYGNCTSRDVELLRSRIAGKPSVDLSSDGWQNAPIVFGNNASKDAWNWCAIAKFAEEQNCEVQCYTAQDSHNGKLITDPRLVQTLRRLHTGETSHLLGSLPLVEGMKVIIGLNYDVGNGVVNGSEGILKKVYYTLDSDGEKHATSAVVHVHGSSGNCMPGLGPHEKVVFTETKNFTIQDDHTSERMVIACRQLPLDAAYAITDYKLQGKTFANVILDIQSSRMIQSTYVMLSRAMSLDGVVILHDFDERKVRMHASQSLREELNRLDTCSYQTILASESETDRHDWALKKLAKQRSVANEISLGFPRKRGSAHLDDENDNFQGRKRLHVISHSLLDDPSFPDHMEVD